MARGYIDNVRLSPRQNQGGIRDREVIIADLGYFSLATAAGDVLTWTPGFSGRVIHVFCITDTITTDTDADGTLTLEKNGSTSGVTGGVITLADDTGPDVANEVVNGTAITAFTAFDGDDYLDFAWAVTNAFANGAVRVYMLIEPSF
jgi:hypothetical protein